MLQGKVAWITGAGSGIGRSGAVELAKGGASVVLSGRRGDQLADAAAEIAAAGGQAETVALDVADRAAVAKAASGILERHGHVDILVNSAGINRPNRFWKNLTPESFAEIVGINLNGALYCIHAVLPTMRARREGLVINISSWAGRFETYMTGPAYNSSKHAMAALTMSLNDEEMRQRHPRLRDLSRRSGDAHSEEPPQAALARRDCAHAATGGSRPHHTASLPRCRRESASTRF